MENYRLERFNKIVTDICDNSRFQESKKFVQHGETSVFAHSVSVAYNSYRIANFLGIRVNERALIRGALLHDYFLYDWHVKDDGNHRLHGFRHPKKALLNALEEFELNAIEENLIKCHMFPLTPIPPTHREGVLVCLVDKLCSITETLRIPVLKYALD